MTDSPALQAALDPQEEPILNDILTLRDQLLLLKRDKSTYIKSHDVLGLYDNVVEQVHLLNGVRKEHGKPLEQNRGGSPLRERGVYSNLSDPAILPFQLIERCHSRQCLGRLFSAALSVLPDHRTQ